MKSIMYITLILATCLSAGCGGAGGSGNSAEEKNFSGTNERKPTATVYDETRKVTLYDPYMQNAQVLTIDCLPGWQLVGRVDLEEFQQDPLLLRRERRCGHRAASSSAAQHEAALHHCRGLSAICGKDTVSPCTVHRTEGCADLRQTAGRDETIR